MLNPLTLSFWLHVLNAMVTFLVMWGVINFGYWLVGSNLRFGWYEKP